MTFDALKILIFSLVCKKKIEQKKKQNKEKEKNYSIAIILQKIICVKSPVLSFTQSVSQSVSKTDYQSIFRLAAKLGTHIAVSNSQLVVQPIDQHSFSQLVK